MRPKKSEKLSYGLMLVLGFHACHGIARKEEHLEPMFPQSGLQMQMAKTTAATTGPSHSGEILGQW